MREYAIENDIWDEGQTGAVEGVLGTVNQLIMDRCIMEEVKHIIGTLKWLIMTTQRLMTRYIMIGC